MAFSFDLLLANNGFARLGKITTPHGVVETPNFIFCATKAAIKSIPTSFLKKLGVQFLLGNTYHLMLRPGGNIIEKQGGLHRFMAWDGPLLSDSGGYQIFAMGHGSVAAEVKRRGVSTKSLLTLTEAGAFFKSYVDGKKIFLSPEKSSLLQHQFGVDFAVQLDECTAFHITKQETEAAMRRSMRWGDRSLSSFMALQQSHNDEDKSFKRQLAKEAEDVCFKETSSLFSLEKKLQVRLEGSEAFLQYKQQMAGVVQGGIYNDLRLESVKYVCSRPYFYVAIGGSLGSERKQMFEVVSSTMEMIRANRIQENQPVHLLGIGGIADIFNGVKAGIDTFDCVLPTRIARHGHAIVPAKVLQQEGLSSSTGNNNYTFDGGISSLHGVLNLQNSQHRNSILPLDASQKATWEYSRGYLHHLLKAKEISAMVILTMHNIAQMCRLFADIRAAIAKNTFKEVEDFWLG